MSSGMLISKIALKGHRIYVAFAQSFSEPENSEGEEEEMWVHTVLSLGK